MPSAQAVVKRAGGARRTSVSQSWKVTGHFVHLHAQMSGDMAEIGLVALLSLMALLSLNLGILNLLPVPILDGGHIMIMALEGVSRRDFSTQVKERVLLVGFVMLMTLMVTVIYNDLTRVSWIERFMLWR